jgi:hypothetical protein
VAARASLEGSGCWNDAYGRGWSRYGVLNGVPPFESLDWVLEELYEDRSSAEMPDAGAKDGLGVIGVRALPLAEAGKECVSRVRLG